MAVASADGRPPSHRARSFGWRWGLIGLGLVMAVIVAWSIITRVEVGVAVPAVAFGILLLACASPAWISGLIRAREHRAARRSAESERTIV